MPLPMFKAKEKEQPLIKVKHVIGVAAGKGGVGKSTVALNIALALQKLGYAVGILDADIYGPSLRKMLPEDQLPTQSGEILTPATCAGIKMISMAYFRKSTEAAVVRAPIVNSLITQFLKNVNWGALDFLIIDFPPGTGDIQLTLSQQANLHGVVMVTTPQEVAVMDVRKAMHMFNQVRIPIIGIVENMSYYQSAQEKVYLFGKGGGERLARESGVPFLGAIPIDSNISKCGDEGQSLFKQPDAENSETVKTFFKLAEQIVAQVELVNVEMIKQIYQKDPHSITILWSDGKVGDYQLKDLQKVCPCAGCVDENTGKRVVSESSIDSDVKAMTVNGVGRYAIRIEFTSGCSKGIYDFDMLRNRPLA